MKLRGGAKHREVAALLVKLLVSRAFVVEPEHRGVVEIRAAHFVEARDGDGGVARGDYEDALHLRRVRRERPAPRLDLRVGIAGEEALGKGDDLRAFGIGALHPLLEVREVVLEVPDPRLELTVGDAHRDAEDLPGVGS